MLTEFLLFLSTIYGLYWLWERYQFTYWQRRNIKNPKTTTIVGNLKELFLQKNSMEEQFWGIHKEAIANDVPLIGFFKMAKPALLIRDTELIKRIMIKDFNQFTDRVLQVDPHHDPLAHNNLFFIRNPQWRALRTKLSPVFTSGKIKQMYPLMVEIAQNMEKKLATIPDGTVMQWKTLCSQYTTDLIGSIAFGIQANSLNDTKSEFYRHTQAIFELSLRRALEFIVTIMLPFLSSLARATIFPKATSCFLRRSIKFVMEEREKSGIKRNDLIDILVNIRKESIANPDKLIPGEDLDFLVAQAAVFQLAGFETSSSTMVLALYELARHQDVQDRLRAELLAAFEESDDKSHLSYEKIFELTYLGQIVDETLRLYPNVGHVERLYNPENKNLEYNLKPFVDSTIPYGTPIYVSQLGIHRDAKYWPEPDKFDPERFSPKNRDNINMDAYLPFGIGPRNCIGMRQGLLQTRLGLAHLLRNHRVVTCEQTPKVIKFDPKLPTLVNQGGIHLKLERIN